MHIGRHGAFAKCSTYFCLAVPSHTQWLISSLQDMAERRLESSVGSWWNKIIWDNLPSPLSVTKMPYLLWILYFLQAVSSSNSSTQILGSQMRHLRGSPSLLCMCSVSVCIKAVEKKKQHCPISASVFRPWHTKYQTSSQKFSAKVKIFLLILKVKTDIN